MSANFTSEQKHIAEAIGRAEIAGFPGLAAAFAGILHRSLNQSNHPPEATKPRQGSRNVGKQRSYGSIMVEKAADFDAIEKPSVSPTEDR